MKRKIEHSLGEKIRRQFESNSYLQIATLVAAFAIAGWITKFVNEVWWGMTM